MPCVTDQAHSVPGEMCQRDGGDWEEEKSYLAVLSEGSCCNSTSPKRQQPFGAGSLGAMLGALITTPPDMLIEAWMHCYKSSWEGWVEPSLYPSSPQIHC